MRKFLSIVLVLTAYSLLLLHSVIPHHHHHEEFTKHHDASGPHDDDNDTDHNFLSNAFSLLQHDNTGTIVYQSVSLTFKCTKFNVDKYAFLHEAPVIIKPDKPPLIYSYYTVFHFSSSFIDILQLRGPLCLWHNCPSAITLS